MVTIGSHFHREINNLKEVKRERERARKKERERSREREREYNIAFVLCERSSLRVQKVF